MEKKAHYGNMTGNAGTIADIKEKARYNRMHPTPAETKLWNSLTHEFGTIRFRRQHVIGDYIADFVCLKSKLVIEVDGGYHNTKAQRDDDNYRTWYLNNRGFRVIRFANSEVLNNIEQVTTTITKYLLR